MSELHIHGIGTCAVGLDDANDEASGRLEAIPIKEYLKPVQTRRFGRVAKMMYVAAQRALIEAGLSADDSMGIVAATAMGEVDVSLKLIEQIYRTQGVTLSPALIPNSVHNSPAGYMTIAMKSHAPAITVSQGWLSVEAGLTAADDLLSLGGLKHVLLVVGDEYDPAWHQRLVDSGATGLAKSLLAQEFTEGAVALVLSVQSDKTPLGCLRGSLNRFDGTPRGLWAALQAIGSTRESLAKFYARSSAGASSIVKLASKTPFLDGVEIQVDGDQYGKTLTGPLLRIVRHIRDGRRESILTLGLEVDELGLVTWQGEA